MAAEWQASVERLTRIRPRPAPSCPAARRRSMGEIFANPRLARSLELIARDGKDAFYAGPIAQAIAADMQARDGLLTAQIWPSTPPTGSRPSAPATAASTCTRCRPARRASSPSRC